MGWNSRHPCDLEAPGGPTACLAYLPSSWKIESRHLHAYALAASRAVGRGAGQRRGSRACEMQVRGHRFQGDPPPGRAPVHLQNENFLPITSWSYSISVGALRRAQHTVSSQNITIKSMALTAILTSNCFRGLPLLNKRPYSDTIRAAPPPSCTTG